MIPGFTAEATLARSPHHPLAARARPPLAADRLQPAVGGEGFIGMPACIADCMDANPGLSRAECRRRCTAPSPPFPGGGGGGGGFNQDLCVAACEVNFGVCVAASSGFGTFFCRKVANACKASCRRNI